MQVVERDPDPLLHRPFILRARREVRRVQDALAIDALERRDDVLDFAARHALEPEPLLVKHLQDLRMPVGLHRVEDARRCPAAPCSDCARRLQRRAVVDERSAVLAAERQQLAAAILPPLPCSVRALVRAAVQLFPRRAEHAIGSHLADRDLVQARDQPIAVRFVDHERDVEIVRGLRDQIDLLLFEQLERFAEPVQDRADVTADQAHGGARADDFDAAQPARDPRPAHRASTCRARSPPGRATP